MGVKIWVEMEARLGWRLQGGKFLPPFTAPSTTLGHDLCEPKGPLYRERRSEPPSVDHAGSKPSACRVHGFVSPDLRDIARSVF